MLYNDVQSEEFYVVKCCREGRGLCCTMMYRVQRFMLYNDVQSADVYVVKCCIEGRVYVVQ